MLYKMRILIVNIAATGKEGNFAKQIAWYYVNQQYIAAPPVRDLMKFDWNNQSYRVDGTIYCIAGNRQTFNPSVDLFSDARYSQPDVILVCYDMEVAQSYSLAKSWVSDLLKNPNRPYTIGLVECPGNGQAGKAPETNEANTWASDNRVDFYEINFGPANTVSSMFTRLVTEFLNKRVRTERDVKEKESREGIQQKRLSDLKNRINHIWLAYGPDKNDFGDGMKILIQRQLSVASEGIAEQLKDLDGVSTLQQLYTKLSSVTGTRAELDAFPQQNIMLEAISKVLRNQALVAAPPPQHQRTPTQELCSVS